MNEKLDSEFERRREMMEQFYYRDIGQVIKKLRISSKMTQESVAYGICSHTYISKLENNQIIGKRENVILIMEKMNVPIDEIYFPDEMISSLEDAINCFFYRDLPGYKEIFERISEYNFSTLLQVIKLGYYILSDDYEEAGYIYNETFRYLNSLEDYGLSIFLIFAGYYNIGIKKYSRAKEIIGKIESKFINDDITYALYSFSRFIIYGNLYKFLSASEACMRALTVFNKYSNMERINEIHFWRKLFKLYETNTKAHEYNLNCVKFINRQNINYFLVVLALSSNEPQKYLNHLDKDSVNYSLGLFFKAKLSIEDENNELFTETYNELDELHYKVESKLDYLHMLRLLKSKKEIEYKDYLINFVIDYLQERQDFFFLKLAYNEIVEILTNKNRYKDALIYKNKFEQFVLVMQS